MNAHTAFSDLAEIRIPVIMAPMFLVSNEPMMEAAMRNGLMGVFPTLNYRAAGTLDQVTRSLAAFRKTHRPAGSYGVNLIVQQSNPLMREHLEICVRNQVPFYITSLGSPKPVIEAAHDYNAKVFCDVTNMKHAQKCAELGCDGFIAVGQGAGGHAGPHPLSVLIPALRKNFPDIPVVAAGGIATGSGILAALALGAAGVSIGTRFIASTEARVNDAYKQAVIDSGMDDIVMTERLSGTPCAIINTPYARHIGMKQNFFERWLSQNRKTKKYFKTLVNLRGLKSLEKAIIPGNYKTLWCAGKSSELIDEVLPCDAIVKKLESEMEKAMEELRHIMNP